MSALTDDLLWQLRAAGIARPVTELRFAPPRRWRFDLAWPDRMLAVECDGGTWSGGRHTRGAGYERDCEKCNTAVLRGWRVLRVTSGQVVRGEALAWIEEALR